MTGALSIGYYFHLPPGLKGSVVSDLATRSMEPLLGQLGSFPELRPCVACTGAFWDCVQRSEKKLLLNRIAAMAKEGLIELVATPHYDPPLIRTSLEDFREQIILNVDCWRKRGCAEISMVWLRRNEWFSELESVLQGIGIRTVIFEDVVTAAGQVIPVGPYRSTTGMSIVLQFRDILDRLFLGTPSEALTVIKKLITPHQESPQPANLFLGVTIEQLMRQSESTGVSLLVWWERLLSHLAKAEEIKKSSLTQLLEESIPGEIQLASLQKTAGTTPVLPIEQWPGADRPEALKLTHRLNDMAQQIEQLLERRGEMSKKLFDERFGRAKLYLLGAQVNDAYYERPGGGLSLPHCRAAVYEALIRSQVEADSIRHPDIDPNYGWVEAEAVTGEGGEEDICVDTQLMRLYLSAREGGALTEWDYKPRKVNLCNTLVDNGRGEMLLYRRKEALAESAVAKYPPRVAGVTLREYLSDESAWVDGKKLDVSHARASKFKITRHSKGLLGLRYDSELLSSGLILSKEFIFKSGIGAHLNYSTTGFHLEYTLEGEKDKLGNKFLVIEWSVMLPSAEVMATSASPLMCVGGVSEKHFSALQGHEIPGGEVPGGIYGIRLIDSLNDFLIDFRTSKPLHSVELQPLYSHHPVHEGETAVYQGTTMYLVVPVDRLRGGYSPFTLFVSIM